MWPCRRLYAEGGQKEASTIAAWRAKDYEINVIARRRLNAGNQRHGGVAVAGTCVSVSRRFAVMINILSRRAHRA